MTTGAVVKLCSGCELRLLEATMAIRHHESEMNSVMELARKGGLDEESKQCYKASLTSSFNDAQSAWDAYRDHLIGHGILPKPS